MDAGLKANPTERLNTAEMGYHGGNLATQYATGSQLGRWLANVIHDGSEEVLAGFPETTSGAMKREVKAYDGDSTVTFLRGRSGPSNQHGDSGSASRFFYCAKASKKERDEGLEELSIQSCGMMEDDDYPIKTGSGNLRDTKRRNIHPTVKPLKLMRYLCRLVTPPNGIILDPFLGSGSTGKAAHTELFRFIGIELDEDYCKIAALRCKN